MPDTQAVNTSFVGTVPENYERYLGPLMFKPYAQDLACRLLVGDQAPRCSSWRAGPAS